MPKEADILWHFTLAWTPVASRPSRIVAHRVAFWIVRGFAPSILQKDQGIHIH
jgi:hypothetical protein